MTHAFVSNGDTQLVLVPADEVERLLLKKLLDGPSEIVFIQDQVSILGKVLSGGVIIRRKSKSLEPDKTESGEKD